MIINDMPGMTTFGLNGGLNFFFFFNIFNTKDRLRGWRNYDQASDGGPQLGSKIHYQLAFARGWLSTCGD